MRETGEKIQSGASRDALLFAVILLAALALRLVWLEPRPLHHDESIHAYYSWRIVTEGPGDYRYDPVYHGPVLYYLTAGLYALFGASDFTSRLLPVLCGVGLVALAWPLRALLGRREALVLAVLLTLSPTLGYYSRSLRHDVPVAFFTLAGLVALLYAIRNPQRRFLYTAGVAAGLAAATKEDIYLTSLAFANALWMVGLGRQPQGTGLLERARRWSADVRSFVERSGMYLATAIVLAFLLFLSFYTSLLTHPENWNAVQRAITYWWGQHQEARIPGPWWYYLPLGLIYEPVPLLAALATLVAWSLRGAPDRASGALAVIAAIGLGLLWGFMPPAPWPTSLVLPVVWGLSVVVSGSWMIRGAPSGPYAFVGVWAVFAFALYAWAQEKVPWLLVPMLVPQAIVASWTLARSRWSWCLWAPLGALSLWGLVASNYLHDAPRPEEPPESSHAEPMVYVQTTYDVPEILATIREATEALGTGRRTRMAVVGEATWPLSWYLRDYPVQWNHLPREADVPILVMGPGDAGRLGDRLEPHYRRYSFAVRGWWVIDWSRATPENILRFLVHRLSWNAPGTTDAVLFVIRDPSRQTALPGTALRPAAEPRPYTGAPASVERGRAFGRRGAALGALDAPKGLSIDREGNLVVADSGNHRVQKFSADGQPLAAWGAPSPGDGPLDFREPSDVAVGPDGTTYVADTWNHRIQKLAPDGSLLDEWREESPSFWGPRAVAVAPDGRVFVVDTGNKRVIAYDPDGTKLWVTGGEGDGHGEFVEPVGVAIDPAANQLFIADTANHRVQVFSRDGRFLRTWPVHGWTDFYTQPHLAWSDGLLWTTDSSASRINAYRPDGELVHSLRTIGDLRLDRPMGITVAPDGTVYVSDAGAHRIVAFTPGDRTTAVGASSIHRDSGEAAVTRDSPE